MHSSGTVTHVGPTPVADGDAAPELAEGGGAADEPDGVTVITVVDDCGGGADLGSASIRRRPPCFGVV